ncbi:hypothetical protein V7147_02090 [Bacillus sp. JJ1521]
MLEILSIRIDIALVGSQLLSGISSTNFARNLTINYVSSFEV